MEPRSVRKSSYPPTSCLVNIGSTKLEVKYILAYCFDVMH